MPDEAQWSSYFNCAAVIDAWLGAAGARGDVLEFGCGYGSFTLPVARRSSGVVTALDIEPGMIATVREKAARLGVDNIRAQLRDFVTHGAGVAAGTQAHAMIFNLLHLAHPVPLLQEARRTLIQGGTLCVMHWRCDIITPRGPPLAIRPTPTQCRQWMAEAGLRNIEPLDMHQCGPFHFALVGHR